MSFAVDVNILLCASDADSPYFEPAKAFIETCIAQHELFYLGWPTVMSYIASQHILRYLLIRYLPTRR